jgi:hypothetical protein
MIAMRAELHGNHDGGGLYGILVLAPLRTTSRWACPC